MRSQAGIDVVILEVSDRLEGLIREAPQKMVNCWNSDFEGAEEIVVDFCFYVSVVIGGVDVF
jgi:hypothetical protein